MTVDFHCSFLFFGFLVYACFANGGCEENPIDTRATNTMPTIVELVSVENTTSDASRPNKEVVYKTIDNDSSHRVDQRPVRSHAKNNDGSSSPAANLPSIRTTTTATISTYNGHNSTATRLDAGKTHKDASDHNRTVLLAGRGRQKFHPIDGKLVNSLEDATAAAVNARTTTSARRIVAGTDNDATRATTTQKQADNDGASRGQKSSPAFHYRGGDGYAFETQFIADRDNDEHVRKFDKTRKYVRGGDDPENNIDRIRNYNGNNINVKIGNVVKKPQGFSLTTTTTTPATIENYTIIRKTLPKVTVRNGAPVVGPHRKPSNDESTSADDTPTVSSSSSSPRENEIVKKPAIKLVSASSSLPNRRKTTASNGSGDNLLPTTSTAWALASLKTPLVPKVGPGSQLKPSGSVEVLKRNNVRLHSTTGVDRTLTMTTTTIKPFVPWAVRLQKTTTEDQRDWTTTMRNLTDDVMAETVAPNSLLETEQTVFGTTNKFPSLSTMTTSSPPTTKSKIVTISQRVNTLVDSMTVPTAASSESPFDQIDVRIKDFDKNYSESLAHNTSNSNTIPDVDVKAYTQTAGSHVTKSYDNFVKPTTATSTIVADSERRHHVAGVTTSSTTKPGKHGVVVQIHDLGLNHVETLAPKFETQSTTTPIDIPVNNSQLFNVTTYSTYTVPQMPTKASTLKTEAYDEITRNLFGMSPSINQRGNDIDYVHSSESTTRFPAAVSENSPRDSELEMLITSSSKPIHEDDEFQNNRTNNGIRGLGHIMQIGSSHETAINEEIPAEDSANNTSNVSSERSELDEITKVVPLDPDHDIKAENGIGHYDDADQNVTMAQHNLKDNNGSEEMIVDIGSPVEGSNYDQHKLNYSSYSDASRKVFTTNIPHISSTSSATIFPKVQQVDESTEEDNVHLEVTTLVAETSEKMTTFSTIPNHRNHPKLASSTNAYATTTSTTSKPLDTVTVTSSPATTLPPYQPTPAIISGVENETKAPKTTESVEITITSHVTPPSSTSSKPKLSPENIPGYLMLFFKSSFAEVCGTSAKLRENLFQYITRRSYRIQSKDQVLMMVDPEQCKEPDNSVRLIPVALYIVDGVGSYDKNLIHEMKTLLEEENLNNYTLPIHEIVYHENIIPDNSRIIAAMVITSIAAISFVLLLFLMCTIRNRQKLNYGQRCTPVSIDDFNLDNISEYNSIRRKSTSRASKRSYGNPTFDDPAVPSKTLTFNGLLKACENRRNLDEEFSQIPVITVKPEELPAGAEVKNRYANVIPLPETRISLSSTNKCSDSVADYINANYVKGFKGADKFYIACQAPLQNTIEDFWKMVWKEQTKVIIMLTGLTENGIEKCADYLPPSEVLDCHRLFGEYQITLKKREVKEKYVISSLQLKNMENNLWREVTHLWYTSWPIQGVPSEQSSIIALLIEARAYMRNSKGPHVVHCSPGTGRTGTVIAIDICIRDYESTRSVNIPSTVARLRRCRAGAVQTKEQYAFVYKVLALYAKKLNGGTTLDSM